MATRPQASPALTAASIRSYRRISREKGGYWLVKTRYEFNTVKMILTPDN